MAVMNVGTKKISELAELFEEINDAALGAGGAWIYTVNRSVTPGTDNKVSLKVIKDWILGTDEDTGNDEGFDAIFRDLKVKGDVYLCNIIGGEDRYNHNWYINQDGSASFVGIDAETITTSGNVSVDGKLTAKNDIILSKLSTGILKGNGAAAVTSLGNGSAGQYLQGGTPSWTTPVGLRINLASSTSANPLTANADTIGVMGILAAANGGTGIASSTTANRIFATAASGTTATAPSWRALVAADIPDLDVAKLTTGTLPVARGGTGATTFTSGNVLIGNGTSAVTTRAIDTTMGGTSGSSSLITSGAVNAIKPRAMAEITASGTVTSTNVTTGLGIFVFKFTTAFSMGINAIRTVHLPITGATTSAAYTAAFEDIQTNNARGYTMLQANCDNANIVSVVIMFYGSTYESDIIVNTRIKILKVGN